MKNVGKAKVILGATLATGIVAGSMASYMGYGPFSTRAASLSSNFSTNQNGFGQQKTITIDGDFSDWDSSMLIAQGVANDDPRAFRGPHEGPVYDTYAMYGAWDNDNLYLMWEITNLTDVVAPEQNYPISDNGKAWNGDIPQIIALDIDPNVSADGTISSTGKGVWGMSIDYTNGVDNLLCFSSKLVAGTPALFSVDGNGGFSYEKEFCRDFKTLGIEAAYGDGHISDELIGINANGYTGLKTDMMYSDSSAWVDLNKLGHNSEQDTMYEIKIPLSALGIDAHYITENGIGVMHISTFGESAIQTLPVDTCVYDNAEEPYAADDSTSQEKADEDTISVNMARLGKGDGPVPTKLPTAKPTVKPTEEPTIAPTVKPTVIPTCIPEETETPYETLEPEKTLAPTDYNYGKPDNNNHDNEEVYNIEKKNNPSKAKLSADDMKNGTILHAWSWSFNTIKENLQNIQNAGYSAIQTSPAQICRNPNGGDRHLSNWEYQYQPIGFKVGNYQLGTEDDLKALCAEADKYGIKIIVDCVYNHLTYDMQLILPEYRVDSYYHGREGIDDYNNRYRVTQKSLLGLYDMNTQNPEVQNIILNYAKQLVSDGVDGFRYDAAKHIELPDDDASYRSNFWPVVLNNGSSFQYGEILQDAASRDNAYSKLMGVTASGYGYILREQLGNKTLNTNKLLGYSIDAPSSKVVTWVESHDNFANKDCETVWMTNDDLKLGWAVIAGRASTTPLFYSRPVGAGGTSYDSRFPGLSQLGDAGDEFYMSADVTAINIFRNEMEGENEYLSNPYNSESVLFIERGNKGILI
nr:hypothetical protein [Lachnospiraceae bacterium]